MALDQHWVCGCGCGSNLPDDLKGVVGEHTYEFVALGCEEKPDKLFLPACAMRKTAGPRGDLNTIAHVKRLRDGRTQADKRAKRGFASMVSRGFQTMFKKKMDGTVIRK